MTAKAQVKDWNLRKKKEIDANSQENPIYPVVRSTEASV
jgi:hypothetical protein